MCVVNAKIGTSKMRTLFQHPLLREWYICVNCLWPNLCGDLRIEAKTCLRSF